MKRRAFVFDPVCALPYGHNVVGLKYFSEAIKPYFNDVVAIASRALPENIAKNYGFEREFDFYYKKHIKIDNSENFHNKVRENFGQDLMLDLATRDVGDIFLKYGVSGADSIVLPCLDYYCAMGLLAVLRGIDPEFSPTAYFRFIGVMENATTFGSNGLAYLIKEIQIALEAGYKIRLCAETPAYADHLADRLGTIVSVVPYPVHAEFMHATDFSKVEEKQNLEKYSDSASFKISCPGSARFDKGYLRLLEIFSNVRKRDPRQTIKFLTQTLPIADALSHANYTNQLYATPGVKLLPSAVSEDEMNALYKQSDLIILPYDPVTYEYRGSAVFMECISRGIPVVALEGSAFCQQIAYYGAGSVVRDVGEIIEKIFYYRDLPKKEIIKKMLQSRHRYTVDSDSAIAYWIK